MSNRELQVKQIAAEFAKWRFQIENLNSLNLYDANIFSEYSICELLNIVFDYNLKNINLSEKNFPAIDLADEENRLAIQVTSTNSKKKIQYTLNKFFENKLQIKYEKLYIFILGVRQKKYTNLEISNEFIFLENEHIIDFDFLLKIINILPLNRINKIIKLLEEENAPKKIKKNNENIAITKRKLTLKKKLQKDFLSQLDSEYWRYAMYEPWIKFRYRNAIIRSVDDKTWPNHDLENKTKISGWFKGEFWDFYDNGIELISMGGDAIFDKDGNWDKLNWGEDGRKQNPNYKVVPFHNYLRIPYEYIVEYDMDPDPYQGLPTIYVEYAKDGMPYEEMLYGNGGWYNKKEPHKSVPLTYFDNNKRKTLP